MKRPRRAAPKRAAAKPKPWVRVLNSARENNIQPTLSANEHVLHVKTPLGRADIERNGMQTAAGKEYARLSGVRRYVPRTIPQVDPRAPEKIRRDGLTRYILDARGKPRITEKFDPVTLRARLTKIGERVRDAQTARLSVTLPVIGWVIQSGTAFESWLVWDKLSDTQQEVTALRSTQDLQTHLEAIIKPPGTGFRNEGTHWLSDAQDYVYLAEDSDIRWFWSTQDPRRFRVQELVMQPDKTLRLEDLVVNSRCPLKIAFIRFPGSVCKEAYEESADNCAIHQISRVLGVPKEQIESIVDESVATRYAHRDETNPFFDVFEFEFKTWRDEHGGITPAALVDMA